MPDEGRGRSSSSSQSLESLVSMRALLSIQLCLFDSIGLETIQNSEQIKTIVPLKSLVSIVLSVEEESITMLGSL